MEMNMRKFLSNNLITSIQAAEMLRISKQQMTNYVKEGDLDPALVTTQGTLFFKEDIQNFISNKRKETELKISYQDIPLSCMGSSHEVEQYFKENKHKLHDIIYVKIFFEEYDAALNGYYILSEYNIADNLKSIVAPRLILRDINGEEMWLNSTCGYVGAGPRTSERILRLIGIPEEKIEKLFEYDIIEYYKRDTEWEYMSNKSKIRNFQEAGFLRPVYGHMYINDEKLVLLQNIQEYFHELAPKTFLEKYREFVPNPIEVVLLTDEQSKEWGFYCSSFGQIDYYNLIIKDLSGREVWMKLIKNDEIKFYKQKRLIERLEECGFYFDEASLPKWTDELRSWLNLIPKNTYPKLTRLKNKENS